MLTKGVEMAILAECPTCHNKQSVKNKRCVRQECGRDLDKAKRSKLVKYWIKYRLSDGRQKKEYVGTFNGLSGTSITDAKDAMAKRTAEKKENRLPLFDILEESKMTFNDLAKWYLKQSAVKRLSSYDRVTLALNNFNAVFGKWLVNDVKQVDLENYQENRKGAGRADATVDMEVKIAQTAVTKAFDNDLIDGRALKAFRKTKRLLKTGSNARRTLVSVEQYLTLVNSASTHYRAVLIIAFNTGMRLNEIRQLKWGYVDKENKMIRLPGKVVKEERGKNVPINDHVQRALNDLPRALHNDHIITYKGTPLNGPNSLKKQFPETCE